MGALFTDLKKGSVYILTRGHWNQKSKSTHSPDSQITEKKTGSI